LAPIKPTGGRQIVLAFKKAKVGYIRMDCVGPASQAAILKKACASLKLP
jgi:hypothetical protein